MTPLGTARTTRPAPMKEKDLLSWVLELAARTGWRAWHVPAPMLATRNGFVGARQASGLPDVFLLCDDPPRMIIAELKGTNGKLTADQREFLRLARDAAADSREVGVYAWDPSCKAAVETMLTTKVLL